MQNNYAKAQFHICKLSILMLPVLFSSEKAKEAVVSMGTAVFHGGFSTFTAFVLLAFSDSYIFTTFFKMFAMVVTFGLFHGIVFLSVLLSLFGPVFDTDEGSEPVFNPVSPDSPSNLKLKTSPVLPNGNSDSLPTESHVVEKFWMLIKFHLWYHVLFKELLSHFVFENCSFHLLFRE